MGLQRSPIDFYFLFYVMIFFVFFIHTFIMCYVPHFKLNMNLIETLMCLSLTSCKYIESNCIWHHLACDVFNFVLRKMFVQKMLLMFQIFRFSNRTFNEICMWWNLFLKSELLFFKKQINFLKHSEKDFWNEKTEWKKFSKGEKKKILTSLSEDIIVIIAWFREVYYIFIWWDSWLNKVFELGSCRSLQWHRFWFESLMKFFWSENELTSFRSNI